MDRRDRYCSSKFYFVAADSLFTNCYVFIKSNILQKSVFSNDQARFTVNAHMSKRDHNQLRKFHLILACMLFVIYHVFTEFRIQ